MILFYSFAVLILAYYFFTVTSNHILFATPFANSYACS